MVSAAETLIHTVQATRPLVSVHLVSAVETQTPTDLQEELVTLIHMAQATKPPDSVHPILTAETPIHTVPATQALVSVHRV